MTDKNAGILKHGEETIRLDLTTLAYILADFSGNISGEQLADFASALFYGQRAIDSQRRANRFRNSGHWIYPPKKREELVKKYREGRATGKILRKGSWARYIANISVRTLLRWEKEFPE